jgi:hypothetical protein
MSEPHDGRLDTGVMPTWVEYFDTYIYIQGGHGDMESSSIKLDAKQALLLLTWLEQERETLEQLAKEQDA